MNWTFWKPWNRTAKEIDLAPLDEQEALVAQIEAAQAKLELSLADDLADGQDFPWARIQELPHLTHFEIGYLTTGYRLRTSVADQNIFIIEGAQGGIVGRHKQSDADEVLCCLEGSLTIQLQEEPGAPVRRIHVHAGEQYRIPAGVIHRINFHEKTRFIAEVLYRPCPMLEG